MYILHVPTKEKVLKGNPRGQRRADGWNRYLRIIDRVHLYVPFSLCSRILASKGPAPDYMTVHLQTGLSCRGRVAQAQENSRNWTVFIVFLLNYVNK